MRKILLLIPLISANILYGESVDKFIFNTPDDLTENSNEDEELELALNKYAAADKGRLKLSPRKNFREPPNYILYNRRAFQAYSISLQVEFKSGSHDHYVLGAHNFFLRYVPSRKSLEYGTNTKKWIVVSSDKKKIPISPGKLYNVILTSNGVEQKLIVDGNTSSAKNSKVPGFNKVVLGACGWGKISSNDFNGSIDNLSLQEIDLEYADNIAETKLEPDTIVLYNFSNGKIQDEAKKGAVLSLGANAAIDKTRGGSLKFTPRTKKSEPKTLLTHSVIGKALQSLTLELDVCIKVNGTYKGDSYFICGRSLFVRFSVDRRNFEFGLNVNGKWNVVKTLKKSFNTMPNKWYKLKCTYDNGKMQLYIDNKLYDSKKIDGKIKLYSLVLGSISWSNRKPVAEHEGWLDAIKINAKLLK
jgi:hypothetical protein